jgi:CheY-like chemotaxis protein
MKVAEKKIVMIIDDDSDDRYFFKAALKKLGEDFVCYEAENGIDALQKLRKEEQLPDFIFLDLNMPLMNGKDCLVELKKDSELKNIPVIIYSTSNSKTDIDLTYKLGAVFYLTKPMDVSLLPEKILFALDTATQKRLMGFRGNY